MIRFNVPVVLSYTEKVYLFPNQTHKEKGRRQRKICMKHEWNMLILIMEDNILFVYTEIIEYTYEAVILIKLVKNMQTPNIQNYV